MRIRWIWSVEEQVRDWFIRYYTAKLTNYPLPNNTKTNTLLTCPPELNLPAPTVAGSFASRQ